MSLLTYKIVAYNIIKNFDIDQIVDWAIELLEEGIEIYNIQIIAGLTKPVNFFEGKEFLEIALDELQLSAFSNEQALLSYCTYYIKEIAVAKDIRDNLTKIYKICQEMNYEKELYDFYLLYWAWGDLDYQNYNHYWEGANRDNIEKIVVNKSIKWLENNQIAKICQSDYFKKL